MDISNELKAQLLISPRSGLIANAAIVLDKKIRSNDHKFISIVAKYVNVPIATLFIFDQLMKKLPDTVSEALENPDRLFGNSTYEAINQFATEIDAFEAGDWEAINSKKTYAEFFTKGKEDLTGKIAADFGLSSPVPRTVETNMKIVSAIFDGFVEAAKISLAKCAFGDNPTLRTRTGLAALEWITQGNNQITAGPLRFLPAFKTQFKL